MAKRFEVEARFIAKDEASRVIKRIEDAQDDLSREIAASDKAFAKGELSVEEYTRALKRNRAEQVKLDAASQRTTKSTKDVGSGFSKLAKTAGVVAGITAVARGLRAVTEAAAEDADSLAKLNTTLKVAGDFSKSAAADIAAFALDLERTIGISDNAAIAGFNLAKSFGQTNEQAKQLTAAAVDFAAAADISFTEAVRRLGRATQGSTEDVAKFVPEINKLTKAQLAAGEGTLLLAERFEGLARDSISPFSLAVKTATAELGNLASNLGSSITENETFVDAINSATDALKGFNDLDKPIEKIGINLDAVRVSAERQGISFEELATKLGLYRQGLVETISRQEQWDQAIQASIREEEFLTQALENLALGFESARRAAETQEIEDFIASSESARATLRGLGVTFDIELNDKIEEYEDVLRQARIETDAGIITAAEYREAQVLVGREIDALEAGFRSYADQQRSARRESEGFTDSLRTQLPQLERSVRATDQLTSANQRLASSIDAVNGSSIIRATGLSPFGTGGRIRGGSRGINGQVTPTGRRIV